MEAIQDVLDDFEGKDLAFNRLFDGDMRKVIDFPTMDTQSELGQFAEELDRALELDVDWEKGMVSAQREWIESSIENDERIANLVLGGSPPKKVSRKFQMKIGKYFAKVDKLLRDYKEMRQIIANKVYGEGSRGANWMAAFSMGQIQDALTTDELKRFYQIQNGLELYVGSDSIGRLNRYYGSYEDAQAGKVTKMPELAKYWQENAGYIKKNIGELTNDKYSIIITRHPVDVMRMSDFDNISSCHSPPSLRGSQQQYYKCAVAEARGHGAVVYVVETEDLLHATNTGNIESAEQEIQDGELFRDDKRPMVSGPLEPYTRGRLRQVRYYDSDAPKRWDEGTEVAMPEKRIYGANIPGFLNRVIAWARENQQEVIENMPKEDGKINLDNFWIFGGSYEDTANAAGRRALMSKLLGIDHFEDLTGDMRQNTQTEDALDASAISGMQGVWQREIEEIVEQWNNHYANVVIEADLQDVGDGEFFIATRVNFVAEWELEEFIKLPNSYPTAMHAAEHINEYYGDVFDSDDAFINKVQQKVRWGCRVDIEHPASGVENAYPMVPDELNELCQQIDANIDDKRDSFIEILNGFWRQEGWMEGGAYIKLVEDIDNGDIDSYEWDVRTDGEYSTESYESTASVSHDFNAAALGLSPRILFNILNSRDWLLFIRDELLRAPREELGIEYYLDISNTSAVESGEDITYTIEFRITADDPDARVELFRELVVGDMDDEDRLSNLFDWSIKQIINARLPASQQQNINERLVKTWKGFLSR